MQENLANECKKWEFLAFFLCPAFLTRVVCVARALFNPILIFTLLWPPLRAFGPRTLRKRSKRPLRFILHAVVER